MIEKQIKEELEMSLRIAKGSFFKKPEFGHRFRELRHSAASEKTRLRAQSYARDALKWMLDLKHLLSLDVSAVYVNDGRLLVHAEAISFQNKIVTFDRYVEVGNVSNS